MISIEGKSISPGIAVGPVVIMKRAESRPSASTIQQSEIPREFARFVNAILATRNELAALRARTAMEIGEEEAAIFDAHLLVLDDPLLHLEVSKKLKEERVNVEAVLARVIDEITESFSSMNDPVMRERSADIADVGERLIRSLQGRGAEEFSFTEPSILSARELSPSAAALLDTDKVLGLIVEVGSPTSHTAILANALGIPAVVVRPAGRGKIKAGGRAIVDGLDGAVIFEPDADAIGRYQEKSDRLLNFELNLRSRTRLYSRTQDQIYVNVLANLEIPSEIAVARENGALGIGLYRTEFLFMNRSAPPDEEEQYRHYRVVAEAFPNLPVVLRTIDVGGDKFLDDSNIPTEMNPSLGLRAVRYSLQNPDMLRAQLRAALRASRHGQVRIMFPMIACLEEVLQLKAHVGACANETGIDPGAVDIGIMVETPAAALQAATLAKHVKFFSIGTNDLIQYTMAAERGSEALAYLHRPTHPAVLRLIAMIVGASDDAGIDVTVCGEMAADLRVTPLLIGAGIQKLSTNPRLIPIVKEVVRRLNQSECRRFFESTLAMESATEVNEAIERRYGSMLGDLDLFAYHR